MPQLEMFAAITRTARRTARSVVATILACSGVAALACAGPSMGDAETGAELVWVELVDNQAWRSAAEHEDPLADHRPAEFECAEFFGWRTTPTGEVDVEMLDCDYLALVQPLGRDLPQGTRVEIALYHFDLAAENPATSHMAVLFGMQAVWEKEVSIPGGDAFAPGAVYEESFVLAQDVSAGTNIHLHMHNHGQNSYVFVYLRAHVPRE